MCSGVPCAAEPDPSCNSKVPCVPTLPRDPRARPRARCDLPRHLRSSSPGALSAQSAFFGRHLGSGDLEEGGSERGPKGGGVKGQGSEGGVKGVKGQGPEG